jgi:hypothetical protein
MFPYCNLVWMKNHTIMHSTDLDMLEKTYPGWLLENLADQQNYINDRLRKRYGQTGNGANSIPFGQNPPPFKSSGQNPPGVSLVGTPILGCLQMQLRVQAPGALGVAELEWSSNNGLAWASIASALLTPLPGTGMSLAIVPTAVFSADNLYVAGTPVPRTVLRWQVAFAEWSALLKRGRSPQTPELSDLKEIYDRSIAELKEAADSKDALFDLPASEDTASAITTAAPLFYSETSPYVSADIQARRGYAEDCRGRGTDQ